MSRWSTRTGASAAGAPMPSRRCAAAAPGWSSGATCPVASLDPREGLYAALARRDASGSPAHGWRPEERLSFEAAVSAYTEGPAVAAGVAQRSGRLLPGHDADLVAWAFDPAVERGDGGAARAGHARLTVVGGEVVMQR